MGFIRKIVQSHSKEDGALRSELKKLLKFSPRNISKYKKAFTHRSIQMIDKKGNPINYERLEFLGDSILGSVIAAYLMTKRTDTAGYNWMIWDNKRSPTNPRDKVIDADRSVAEHNFSAYPHDFNSNGFTVDTTNAAFNASGATYIFMAFAE